MSRQAPSHPTRLVVFSKALMNLFIYTNVTILVLYTPKAYKLCTLTSWQTGEFVYNTN